MHPQGATWAPRAPYGAELPPKGATWAPLGPYGLDLAPNPPGQLQRSSQGRFFPARKRLFGVFGTKNGQKKVEIEGVRPIWRDPQRNSVQNPASDVQNGGMATHLVKKMSDIGSDWVPGLASTPWRRGMEPQRQKNIDFP